MVVYERESEPVRMDVRIDEIPLPQVIVSIAQRGRHLVLRIAGDLDHAALRERIDALTPALPDHAIFISAHSQITVMPVISRAEIALHTDALVEAVNEFRAVALALCRRLAKKLGVPLDDLLDAPQTTGTLDSEWQYDFHGTDCCFTNQSTGQVLDVRLVFGNDFGVLDPYFFYRFVCTSEKFHEVANVLAYGFHDTARALDVLEASGQISRSVSAES